MSGIWAGRVGVVIETAPGHFMTVVMRGTKADIEREVDDDTSYFTGTYRRYVPSSRIKIKLEGMLIDHQDTASADDAAWVAKAAPELPAATHELESEVGSMSDMGTWERSSFCGTGTCVEVERAPSAQLVAVRDSKRPGDRSLVFTYDEWRAFVAGVKAGEFDV
jgi:hypothetical protein